MQTRLLDANSRDDVREAGRLLAAGKLVAFPTETVYGLGANARDASAVDALLRAKERPLGKKFTVLIPDPDAWRPHAAPLAAAARALAAAYWPGPLTLVVPDGAGGAIGLRCPDHAATRAMLRAAGVPVLAPSANRSGRPPAETADEVLAAFGGRIAAVLDGGPARLGVASTVVRVDGAAVTVLREGGLSEADVRATAAGAEEERG